MHVIKAQFNKSRLIPVKNVGMRGILSGISIDAYGMLQYLIGRHYKRVPFILGESDIVVNMTIVIGIQRVLVSATLNFAFEIVSG